MRVYNYLCVFASLPLPVHRKGCWHKSSHVCVVNTVCSGVKCRVYMQCVCWGVWESEYVHSLWVVRPLAEPLPFAGRGWMPSVTLEASVWTQLGLLCEVEGPLVSETPVERAACQAEGLSAALLIHKEWTHTHILVIFLFIYNLAYKSKKVIDCCFIYKVWFLCSCSYWI